MAERSPLALPPGLVGPGASDSVVVRYWVPPAGRLGPRVTYIPPKIAPLDTLRLARLEA